ncbi:MAG: hypothetical protein NVV74_19890 [Magnetospirillum sp.]|nr:hypothetical protein [Magnetospirillum sp.]
MDRCHLCGRSLPHHDDECRAHRDLALFARVYLRLRAESRNPLLQANLARQLVRHGRGDAIEAA